MRGEPPPRRRKNPRLPAFDYSQPGMYFVTACTDERACRFGDVVDSEVRLSEIGAVVQERWSAIPLHHDDVELDAFVVMPNHIHGVLRFLAPVRANAHRAGGPATRSVASIVGSFKASVSRNRRERGIRMDVRIWQRGYHEHVIRNDHALERIRRYIAANPANWPTDPENPRRLHHGGATQASPLQDIASWQEDVPAKANP